MIEPVFTGDVRQVLRNATMGDHQRVDALFSDFALESSLDYNAFLGAHARALGVLEPFAAPEKPRLPLLAQDLADLDRPMPEPLPMAYPEGRGAHWGMLYALEGSRLGGAMLARRVPDHLPRRYLSAVHGKGEWVAFQSAIADAALEGDDHWLNDAVGGARMAFDIFAQAVHAERAVMNG